jgi:hypothetical protein
MIKPWAFLIIPFKKELKLDSRLRPIVFPRPNEVVLFLITLINL